jgi:hypothetical protein
VAVLIVPTKRRRDVDVGDRTGAGELGPTEATSFQIRDELQSLPRAASALILGGCCLTAFASHNTLTPSRMATMLTVCGLLSTRSADILLGSRCAA